MTTDELKTRIESVCKKGYDILDVKFYKDTKGSKTIQRVVVVYVVRMSVFSENIDVWDGDSVEKAILRFIDPDQLKALENDNRHEISSPQQVESL